MINLLALKAYLEKSKKIAFLWVALAVFPYLFGYFHVKIHESNFKTAEKLNVCLVQTSILPEQKNLFQKYKNKFISPVVQWNRIIKFINQESTKDLDLIVLPEAALPFSAFSNFYPLRVVEELIIQNYGRKALHKMPKLKKPFAERYLNKWYVSNSFISKTLANIYDAEIVIGLDDFDEKTNKSFNAGFYFNPKNERYQRYEKQKLVPIGEYIPFSLLENYALKKYGIGSSFAKGETSKVFSDKNKLSISICYDETYPKIMREAKLKGAKLFVNITNNAWFYNSKLARQHFDLAKMRAVENGTPLVRACNTSVTAGIDSFGRVIDAIYLENEARAITMQVSSFSYKTLYSFWGDSFILILSFFSIVIYLGKEFLKKNQNLPMN